jgi:hypothetical protein
MMAETQGTNRNHGRRALFWAGFALLLILDGRLDLLPNAIGWVFDWKEFASGRSDGFEIFEQGPAEITTEEVGVVRDINAGPDQLG